MSLFYLGWELLYELLSVAYTTVLHVCVKAISILSASILCQPFKELFHLLVSSLFVLSGVIVGDIVGLCTCTYKEAMMCYSIVLCCGMYEEHCLPTNCDNVVSCIKTPSLC